MSVFFAAVLPFGLSARLVHRVLGSSIVFDLFAQMFALVPGFIGTYGRACFYKQTLRKSSLDLDIGFGSFISKINTTIGRRVLITGYSTIGYADIGDDAVIANRVSILSGRYQHNFEDPEERILTNTDTFSKLKIGNNSFIGDQSVVMANIGQRSIIGAGSVVVKDIPEYSVAVGNPARVIKSRKTEM